MEAVTKYRATDGEEFDTAEECKRHEANAQFERLVGLDEGDISAALDRSDIPLANAFELIGRKCAEARIAAGDVRRKTKPKSMGAFHVDK